MIIGTNKQILFPALFIYLFLFFLHSIEYFSYTISSHMKELSHSSLIMRPELYLAFRNDVFFFHYCVIILWWMLMPMPDQATNRTAMAKKNWIYEAGLLRRLWTRNARNDRAITIVHDIYTAFGPAPSHDMQNEWWFFGMARLATVTAQS